MRIIELHLKNFGKFTDRHLYFHDHVQVIYGENEYGKSTIYAFIKAMLFGLERGRGRAASGDVFSRYEPWENPNYYAGMMRFLCGGRTFRLERQFDRYGKSASLICEDDGEELSVEDGDLEMLLGGMTRASFENTAAIGQLTARPGQELAAELQNYAANYYETGSSEVNLRGALELLNTKRKQTEAELKKRRAAGEKALEKLEMRKRYVEMDAERLAAELKETEAALGEAERKAEDAGSRKEREAAEYVSRERRKKRRITAAGCVLTAVGAALFFISLSAGHPAIALAAEAGCVLLGLWAAVAGMTRKGNLPAETDREGDGRLRELKWEASRIREEYKEKQTEKSNLNEQILEAEQPGETDRKLRERICALELASQKMQEAALGMAEQFGKRLNREASQILCELTEGKYDRLLIEDRLDMAVLCEGRRIPVERLSRGTVEQIYFSLRMAALDILYEEAVPVILDDAFVFYDEKRLKSVLKWLSEQPRQVIIFSCQTREKQLLSSRQK